MRLLALFLASACVAAPALPPGPAVRVPPAAYKSGQTPAAAMRAMSLPPGFQVSLVAAEPKVVQPIAMCFDERGRLWVVEGMAYPKKRPDGQGADRILILEDVKKDGSYAKVTVFMEGLNLVSGIEVGHGGVWVGAAPEFLFIPKDSDDKAGKPVVLLDGWGFHDTHETLNSFVWGPDGWLYGNHGVFTHSVVGKPGAPDAERKKINAGVWRYHPTRHVFEVFAEGTSNPWGLDYDARGEFFNTACVIPHLYHILPGARYQRQAGQHFNPYTYDDIKTIADHAHYAGGRIHRPDALKVPETTDAVGGGHAHSGLAIYNGDNFPPAYRGMLIFGNLHGHRLVSDQVVPEGSGFAGHHGNDFLRSNDATFIPVSQRVGPDGALYVSDWSDVQVCHNNTQEIWDRTNGRLYRVSFGNPVSRAGDMTRWTSHELAGATLDDANEYFVRQSRKVLAERGPVEGAARQLLVAALKEAGPATRRLRALWALQSTGSLDDALLAGALKDADPSVRGWAVRLIAQQWTAGVPALGELAKTEPSAQVRRELASALSYLPLARRAAIAEPLLARAEDASDHNIPLLLWYGIEPLVGADAALGLALAENCRHPRTVDFIYRRLAGDPVARAQVLAVALRVSDASRRAALVSRVVEGVRQTGSFAAPEGWATLVAGLRQGASPELLADLNELDALAGDEASRAFYRAHLADEKAPLPARQRALSVLVAARDRAAAPVVHKVFAEKTTPSFRRALIQSLATVGDEDSPAVLLGRFGVFSPEQLADAVAALAGNVAGGKALLAAVEAGKADKALLSPLVIRQLKSLGDKPLDAQLAAVVGVVNATKADFAKNKARYEAMLKPEAVRKGDLAAGRQLFMSTCGICHTFGYSGNQVGPGLAGSNIGKLDYFLENVLNPNGVIGKDYQLNVFKLKGGATMSGIVQFEDAQSFRLVMPGGAKFTVAKGEVARREILPMSLMPEGLLDALTKEQVINLVAYLQYPDGFPAAAPGVWRLEGATEGETLKVLSVTGGKTSGQKMTAFKASRWSGNDHLWWTGGKVGDTLTLAVPVAAKGTYEVKFVGTKAHDYGTFELRLDGKLLGAEGYDFYHPAEVVTTGELNGGSHPLDAGEHRLEIKILAPNPAATPRNMFGLDYLKLERK
ncbi:MAG: PVC-type heme-binding CxxCH protein [Opitutales bacterium]|jgi:putative membrane-bound dehydrogenase-like protein